MFPGYLWGADWKRYKTPVLRTVTIVGYMQSGKTTLARFLGYRLHVELTRQGVDDNEIAYVETPSLQVAQAELSSVLDLDRVRYLMLFVDDAVKTAHSRRHNVVETRLFTDIRHWSMKRGVLITMYATQDFRLLDRLMRNAMVYIWKTLPPEWWVSTDKGSREVIWSWIGDSDVIEVLEEITKAIYSNDAERSLAALKTAVVRIPILKWGPRIVRGIEPKEPPASIFYRIEEGEGEGEERNDIDAGLLLRALERLLRHIQGEGYRLKWNKGKYLIVRTPLGKELSLGPLGDLEEIRGLVAEVRNTT